MQFHQDRTEKSRRKVKNWHWLMSLHGQHIVNRFEQVWTASDKSQQVWSTISLQPSVARSPNLAHSQNLRAVFQPHIARNPTTLPSGGKSTSSRFNWRKGWTGVKCNFSWEHFQKRYIIRKLSLSWVRMWNFTRIGPKTKKLRLSIIPALRLSYQPRLGQPQKGVNRNFSWPHLDKSYVVRKLSIS